MYYGFGIAFPKPFSVSGGIILSTGVLLSIDFEHDRRDTMDKIRQIDTFMHCFWTYEIEGNA